MLQIRTCHRLILLALTIAVSADSVFAAGKQPDCYVLSVGIDNYAHASKLKGDVNDARSAVQVFAAQKGRLFGTVYATTLVDAQATHASVLKRLQNLPRVGTAGDYFVIFLSGHGALYTNTHTWYFCCQDESGKNTLGDLTETEILETADVLVGQGKKVIIIVDACHSGRLAEAAEPYLSQYQDRSGGGLVVAVACGASQLSNALGPYSAFARAVTNGLNGGADANRDGRVTIQELKNYASNQAYALLKKHNSSKRQDCQIVWSPSIPNNMPLVITSGRPNGSFAQKTR